jgi:hypothetical protein
MSPSVPIQLLRLALPHIPTTGFTIQSLTLASLSLPAPHTPPPPGYSLSTISALFPSPPPRPSTSSRSLSREELRADAQGRLPERGERVGPAKALVEEWLEEGRRVMVKRVLEVGKGEKGVREGLRARVRYNQPVLAQLVEVRLRSAFYIGGRTGGRSESMLICGWLSTGAGVAQQLHLDRSLVPVRSPPFPLSSPSPRPRRSHSPGPRKSHG